MGRPARELWAVLSSREHATLPAQGQRSFRPAARFIRLLFTTVLR